MVSLGLTKALLVICMWKFIFDRILYLSEKVTTYISKCQSHLRLLVLVVRLRFRL